MKAVQNARKNILGDMVKGAPDLINRPTDQFARIIHSGFDKALSRFAGKAGIYKIHPFAEMKLMHTRPERADERLYSINTNEVLNVGYLATAANPLVWGHPYILIVTLNQLNLDLKVTRPATNCQ